MNTTAIQCEDNRIIIAQHASGTVHHTAHTVGAAVTPVTAADETEKMVKQVICEKLGLEETQIKPGISFSDDLGIDSLDVFELMIEMENVFHITIPEEVAEKLSTPYALIEYIKKQTNDQ